MSDFSEFGFIETMMKMAWKNRSGPIPAAPVGPGDDCSVISLERVCRSAECGLLTTTDIMSENIHFRWNWIDPETLGYKLVAVNASDVAAMGGTPLWAFAGLSLEPDSKGKAVVVSNDYSDKHNGYKKPDLKHRSDGILKGILCACEEFGISLCGGDTCASDRGDFLSLTLIGVSSDNPYRTFKPILRSGAKPGDCLILLGITGESAAGLRLLELGWRLNSSLQAEAPADFSDLSQENMIMAERLLLSHLRPRPLVGPARSLAREGLLNSLIDISDGLAQDIAHICDGSGVSICLESQLLIPTESLSSMSKFYGWNPLELMLGGGEDYALAGTASPANLPRITEVLAGEYPDLPFAVIGRVMDADECDEPSAGHCVWFERSDGSRERVEGGWDHFNHNGKFASS